MPEISTDEHDGLILLTGATGYIGGRLLKALEDSGCRVRCLARRPEMLTSKIGREARAKAVHPQPVGG